LIGPGIFEPVEMLVFRQNLACEGGGFAMKKKRFSVEQMIGVLKQAQVGVPVAEVIRKAGISEQTFYRWKAKYAGLEVDQVRQMAQLQEENLQLKRLVADLTLDKTMLQDVLAKKW
jgi:putative transposase